MRRRRNADEVARSLRGADRDLAKGLTGSDICRKQGIAETAYDRGRQRYAPLAMRSAREFCRESFALAHENSPHCNRGRMERFNKEPRNAGERKMALEHEALTEPIIGAAIEVHRCLGPGFPLNFAKTTLEPKRVIAACLSESVPGFLPSSFTVVRGPESATDSACPPKLNLLHGGGIPRGKVGCPSSMMKGPDDF